MAHEHRFWNMGGTFECACGATRVDDRTDGQRTADRRAAATAANDRIHAAYHAVRGADAPCERCVL